MKLSKSQWESIGRTAGWMKKSSREASELETDSFQHYEFPSSGNLHRNVLLDSLEDQYGLTFRDYDLSTTGIKAKNLKTERILKNLFNQGKFAPNPQNSRNFIVN